MKTSMNNAEQIEAYLCNIMNAEDRMAFEENLIIDAELYDKVEWQKKAYATIVRYGRKNLRKELESIEYKIFNDSMYKRFQQKVLSYFNF
jgi:hypothetical protein